MPAGMYECLCQLLEGLSSCCFEAFAIPALCHSVEAKHQVVSTEYWSHAAGPIIISMQYTVHCTDRTAFACCRAHWLLAMQCEIAILRHDTENVVLEDLTTVQTWRQSLEVLQDALCEQHQAALTE